MSISALNLPPKFLNSFNKTPEFYVLRNHSFVNKTLNQSSKSIVPQQIRCCVNPKEQSSIKQTCKNCKTQFDPLLNHPQACRFHTNHFGGETKRKFESVHSGGTMSTPNGGQVFQYWHCCGAEDPFDPGCTAAPHASYDD
ncbi:hypothetical protein ACHQM5_009693 [Ranunculus cassubicifolius]